MDSVGFRDWGLGIRVYMWSHHRPRQLTGGPLSTRRARSSGTSAVFATCVESQFQISLRGLVKLTI